MKKKNEKTFDCIEANRSAQLQIYDEIKNFSIEQELAYWKKVREEFEDKHLMKSPSISIKNT